MNDREMESYFATVDFLVEATSYEQLVLWEKKKYPWSDNNQGYYFKLGELDDMPVGITTIIKNIGGLNVMFWESTGMVVDHRIIDKFFEESCSPKWDNGSRLAHTNAMNFHHVQHAIESL